MTSTKNNKPLRIVMILASMPPMPVGGAEVQAVELCRELNRLGVETEIITWGKIWHVRKGVYKGLPFTRLSSILDIFTDLISLWKPKKKKQKTKIVYDDKVNRNDEIAGKVWIGMISRYSLFYINALIYLWLRRKRFDIIHAHMMEWPAFTAVKLGKKLNKPVVIKDSTMNGIFSLLRYPDGSDKQKQVCEYAWCVAMTKAIRDNFLKAGVPETRLINIPNGIAVKPLPAKNSTWSNNVVFVGNLTQQPAKGIDILLFAWKQVVKNVPDAHLTVIGDGDIEAYTTFTTENGITNVSFAGKQTNITDHLLKSDIFVLPSRREGMSNALMEAMMCGLPVVATNVSGSQDLIDNNVSGLLVPIGNIDALSEALLEMLKHPERAKQMGENGYKSIVSKCDIKRVARQYTELYIKILEKA
jgi:glycosyltransferase involved in cell wall biosynthesis